MKKITIKLNGKRSSEAIDKAAEDFIFIPDS